MWLFNFQLKIVQCCCCCCCWFFFFFFGGKSNADLIKLKASLTFLFETWKDHFYPQTNANTCANNQITKYLNSEYKLTMIKLWAPLGPHSPHLHACPIWYGVNLQKARKQLLHLQSSLTCSKGLNFTKLSQVILFLFFYL